MSLLQIEGLYITSNADTGRGVFCIHDIPKDSIIEVAPVIILSHAECQLISLTKLYDYYFDWDDKDKSIAIPLGYGGLYNHSSKANAYTESNLSRQEISFIAEAYIPAGQEILINYLGAGIGEIGLWFHDYNKQDNLTRLNLE